jgi:hypothetical protein
VPGLVRYGIVLTPRQPFGLRRKKRGATHAHPRFQRIKGNTVYHLFNLILLHTYNLYLNASMGIIQGVMSSGVKGFNAFVLIMIKVVIPVQTGIQDHYKTIKNYGFLLSQE